VTAMLFIDRDYVGEDNPRAVARRRGTDCIQTGLMSQACGALVVGTVLDTGVPAFWLGLTLILVGTPILVVGCYRRARIKGYGGGLAVLGLLSFVGAIILIAFPDKNRPRKGFEVIMPMKVSTAWAPPDDDPRWDLRRWGEDQLRDAGR
jgi:hypothetical protein